MDTEVGQTPVTCERCGMVAFPDGPTPLTRRDQRVIAQNAGWRWRLVTDEAGAWLSETLICPDCLRPPRPAAASPDPVAPRVEPGRLF